MRANRSLARRLWRRALALSCGSTILWAGRAAAQQFVVDDVGTVEHGACQVEAWYGEASSWVLPACGPARNLEITAGFGLAEENGHAIEYVFQGKYTAREPGDGRPGVGLVVGLGVDPLAQRTGRRVPAAFAYLPVTAALADDRVLLHGNVGWQVERTRDDGDDPDHGPGHVAIWGGRADLQALPRLAVIGELYGEGRGPAEYQLGLRLTAIPELLLFDISYGAALRSNEPGAGWAVGLALTPVPFR